VGDVVPLTHTTPGWSAKLFRVMGMQILSSTRWRCRSPSTTSPSTRYDTVTFVPSQPATNLPNPRVVGAGSCR
jgi:hypothetical protein